MFDRMSTLYVQTETAHFNYNNSLQVRLYFFAKYDSILPRSVLKPALKFASNERAMGETSGLAYTGQIYAVCIERG